MTTVQAPQEALRIDPAAVAERIEGSIKRALDDFERDGIILGMSGSIDSSLVASLACRAKGAGEGACPSPPGARAPAGPE